MKKPVQFVLGLVLILASLWGGAWLCIKFPFGSGYDFAAFCTPFLVFIGGAAAIVMSFMD